MLATPGACRIVRREEAVTYFEEYPHPLPVGTLRPKPVTFLLLSKWEIRYRSSSHEGCHYPLTAWSLYIARPSAFSTALYIWANLLNLWTRV
jgi:hypothetical protein